VNSRGIQTQSAVNGNAFSLSLSLSAFLLLLFAFHYFSSSLDRLMDIPCSFLVGSPQVPSFKFCGESAIPDMRRECILAIARRCPPFSPRGLPDIKRNRCRDGNLERHSGGYYVRRIWSDMNFPRKFSARAYRAPGAPSRAPTRPITSAHNVGGVPWGSSVSHEISRPRSPDGRIDMFPTPC